jgi:hypothetical protein
VGSPAEFVAEIATCSDCGTTLEEGPAPETARSDGPIGPELWRRLAVTLLVPPALVALSWVPLPGVDVGELYEVLASSRVHVFSPGSNFGVFALGVMPLVSAALIVGLAMLAVPRWRRLSDSVAGRRTIRGVTLGITLLLAVFQGFGIARLLANLGSVYNGSIPLATLTLATGTMLLVGAAELLSRYGLANGYSIVIGATLLGGDVEHFLSLVLGETFAPLSPLRLLFLVVPPVVAVYALARAMGPRQRSIVPPSPHVDEHPGAYRLPAKPAPDAGAEQPPAPLYVRLPSSSAGPIAAVAFLAVEVPRLLRLGNLDRGGAVSIALQGAVAVAVSVALTYALHPPETVAQRWAPGEVAPDDEAVKRARAAVRTAAARSAALLFATLAGSILARDLLGYFPGVGSLFVLTAVGLDLAAAWKAHRAGGALSTVGSTEDVDSADAAAYALEAAGIAVYQRGVHHRSVLQIFGPYVPIDLMVPEAHADEAKRILVPFAVAGGWDEAEAGDEAVGASAAAPKRKKKKRSRRKQAAP